MRLVRYFFLLIFLVMETTNARLTGATVTAATADNYCPIPPPRPIEALPPPPPAITTTVAAASAPRQQRLPLFRTVRELLTRRRRALVKAAREALVRNTTTTTTNKDVDFETLVKTPPPPPLQQQLPPVPPHDLTTSLPPEMLRCKGCKFAILRPEKELFVFAECLHAYHYMCAASISMVTAECWLCLGVPDDNKRRLLKLLPAHPEEM